MEHIALEEQQLLAIIMMMVTVPSNSIELDNIRTAFQKRGKPWYEREAVAEYRYRQAKATLERAMRAQ